MALMLWLDGMMMMMVMMATGCLQSSLAILHGIKPGWLRVW
jgi:hypothetical protein